MQLLSLQHCCYSKQKTCCWNTEYSPENLCGVSLCLPHHTLDQLLAPGMERDTSLLLDLFNKPLPLVCGQDGLQLNRSSACYPTVLSMWITETVTQDALSSTKKILHLHIDNFSMFSCILLLFTVQVNLSIFSQGPIQIIYQVGCHSLTSYLAPVPSYPSV